MPNYFTRSKRRASKNPTRKQIYKHREIEAVGLAGQHDGLYYACVDGMLDFDIKASKYQGVVIRRIKADYYYSKYPPKI